MTININELRRRIDWGYKVANGVVSEILDRLEAAEKERDVLKAKIERMERQKPVGTAHAMPGADAFTVACFNVRDIPVGAKLYALPGAQTQGDSNVATD